jgi:hypothetical protein
MLWAACIGKQLLLMISMEGQPNSSKLFRLVLNNSQHIAHAPPDHIQQQRQRRVIDDT